MKFDSSSEIWRDLERDVGIPPLISSCLIKKVRYFARSQTIITTTHHQIGKRKLSSLKKEEVKVEVEEGRVLQISGKRSKEREEKNNKWHRVERSKGKFLRRLRLPKYANMDQVKASMDNGVLTVTVPKEEVKKLDVKTIDISS